MGYFHQNKKIQKLMKQELTPESTWNWLTGENGYVIEGTEWNDAPEPTDLYLLMLQVIDPACQKDPSKIEMVQKTLHDMILYGSDYEYYMALSICVGNAVDISLDPEEPYFYTEEMVHDLKEEYKIRKEHMERGVREPSGRIVFYPADMASKWMPMLYEDGDRIVVGPIDLITGTANDPKIKNANKEKDVNSEAEDDSKNSIN